MSLVPRQSQVGRFKTTSGQLFLHQSISSIHSKGISEGPVELRIQFDSWVAGTFIVNQCSPQNNPGIFELREAHLDDILRRHKGSLNPKKPESYAFLNEKPCGPFGKLDFYNRHCVRSREVYGRLLGALHVAEQVEFCQLCLLHR